MRLRFEAVRLLVVGAAIVATWSGQGFGALPPGKPHILTIKGSSTVTFVPETGMAPLPIDYKAGIEYLVNTRDFAAEATTARKKPARRPARATARRRKADAAADRPKAAGLVEFALHSAEIVLRQREQVVVQMRIRRSRFQGQPRPGAPFLTVTYNESPPRLRELLDRFDTAAAALTIDEQGRVINRRTRFERPLHSIVETLMSIHTPVPRDTSAWDVPAQLTMGHHQSANGTLRFEREKPGTEATDAPIKVKVSGVLLAEGAIVGNLIKDGTYKVTGEQVYDPKTRTWPSARWMVAIETELTNQGVTIAHAKGKMIVESKALVSPPTAQDPRSSGPASREDRIPPSQKLTPGR